MNSNSLQNKCDYEIQSISCLIRRWWNRMSWRPCGEDGRVRTGACSKCRPRPLSCVLDGKWLDGQWKVIVRESISRTRVGPFARLLIRWACSGFWGWLGYESQCKHHNSWHPYDSRHQGRHLEYLVARGTAWCRFRPSWQWRQTW